MHLNSFTANDVYMCHAPQKKCITVASKLLINISNFTAIIALSVYKDSRPYTHGNLGKLEVKFRFKFCQVIQCAVHVRLVILRRYRAFRQRC